MKLKIFLSLVVIGFAGAAAAQGMKTQKICFTDDAGYVWKFDNITDNGNWTYYATGMVENAYASTSAYMMLDFRAGMMNGLVTATAVNNNPDGCNFYSDSFVYRGSAQLVRTMEGDQVKASYSGSGSWESYCFGGIINIGSWNAWGPCANSLNVPKPKPGVAAPAMGKKAIENLKGGKP